MPPAYIKLSITGSDGTKPEAKVMESITIAVPPELSLRIAAMHVMEFMMRSLKKQGFRDALKAIGLK